MSHPPSVLPEEDPVNAKETGRAGEDAVCRYLTEQGYAIRSRNFCIRGGELDIVASRGEELCFVEVKTRKLGAASSGDEAVDSRKQMRLIRAAYAYCERYEIDEEAWYIRYDIAEVTLWQGRVLDIAYYENAFDESSR